ncbi:hypothetical protein EEL31_08930 [Brevibacillus laterosporus]|nr:hypothetical protein [Brevibacillus laterosporus]TPG68631.1 hypothetical protein EEL31_08930 [Brevibacillus laterosporus]
MKIEIELTNDEIYFLKQIQNDYQIQQEKKLVPYPNLYVLVNYKETIVDPDFECDYEAQYNDPENGEYGIKIDELKEYLTKNHKEEIDEFINSDEYIDDETGESLFDWEAESHIEELIDYLHMDMYKSHTVLKKEDVQTFLTYETAQKHLESNYYHYHKNAFIDRRKPWRTFEMETFIKLLYRIPVEKE